MKNFLIPFVLVALLFSCKESHKNDQTESVKANQTKGNNGKFVPISDSIVERAVIYEANIRQYSPEGTFAEFTKDIPKLKELGVKIIWLMPIYPISEIKRKSADGRFAKDIDDLEKRKSVLGSYYAISDYTAVNPEFGSLQDFRQLIKTAHDNGMYVILDWVPNHTGWDHTWIKEHPEYYTHNEKGEIIDPINPETGKSWGWTDVADLNYENKEMRQKMIDEMAHWVDKENVDGFRCDVASGVPLDFWKKAIPELREIKPLFMLAEADEPELFQGNLFDMGYGWKNYHMFNKLAAGKKNAEDWRALQKKIDSLYEADDILMNFTSNHDENSWSGTVEQRLGKAKETFAALSFAIEGMPLIYSGQEFGLDKQLRFFSKDTILHKKDRFYGIYKKLGRLKNTYPALAGGKNPAEFELLKTTAPKKVIAFKRQHKNKALIFMANVTDEPVKIKSNINGDFQNYMRNKSLKLNKDKSISLKAWEYFILIPEATEIK